MKKANLFLLVALILFGFAQYGGSACDGDFDCDGDVDGSDLAVFAADFGRTDCGPCETLWQQNGSDIYYNDGNVGIGTSSPVWELEVANLTAGDGAESAVTADDAGGAIAAYSSTLPDPFAHYAGRISLFSDGRSMGLDLRADDSAGDIRFYAGGPWPDNERMRITDTGNVGIGTTSPDPLFKLDVAGGIKATGGTGGVDAYTTTSGAFLPWFSAVYGSATTLTTFGYLGGIYGAYGMDQNSGNFGFLGDSDVGVQGENGNGNYGWLGGGVTGAGGVRSNGNYGYLGSTYYGVYGYVTDSESHGVYGYSRYNRGVFGVSDYGYAGYFTGNVHVTGDLSASGTKPFIQPHPKDASKEIVYIALEAPEAVIMLRGTAQLRNGKSVIELPEHFHVVAAEEGMQVQVTPYSADTFGLAVVERSRVKIVVKELKNGQGNFKFDYFITAIRAGFEKHQPIVANTHYKPENNETAEEFEARYKKDDMTTKATRSILISNGILTEDGKLDMAMVKKMSWTVAEKKSFPDRELRTELVKQ
jgi:hypothetical protein